MAVVPRAAVDPDGWDAFVAAHPAGWVWQRSAWLDYLALGRTDASVAVVDALGGLHAVVPAIQPADSHDPQPVPLWTPFGLFEAHAAMHAAQAADPALRWRGQPVPVGPEGTAGDGFYTRVVDLARPEAERWRDVRRSYHALIHRAEERTTVQLVPVAALAELYRLRPDLPQLPAAAWPCLQRLVVDGRLWVLGALDHVGDVVGAVGIYRERGWAYYGHGRALQAGVAHRLLWTAQARLASLGDRWFELGWEAQDGDDEKARGIAQFKRGLGGERWWVRVR